MNDNKTFKARGVEFTVNPFGCLRNCSDWETLSTSLHFDLHRGINKDLFRVGFGGLYFATPTFCALTGFVPI